MGRALAPERGKRGGGRGLTALSELCTTCTCQPTVLGVLIRKTQPTWAMCSGGSHEHLHLQPQKDTGPQGHAQMLSEKEA